MYIGYLIEQEIRNHYYQVVDETVSRVQKTACDANLVACEPCKQLKLHALLWVRALGNLSDDVPTFSEVIFPIRPLFACCSHILEDSLFEVPEQGFIADAMIRVAGMGCTVGEKPAIKVEHCFVPYKARHFVVVLDIVRIYSSKKSSGR